MTVAKAKFLKSDQMYDEILEFPRLASHAQNNFCRAFFSLPRMKVSGSVERSACTGCVCPICKLTTGKNEETFTFLYYLNSKSFFNTQQTELFLYMWAICFIFNFHQTEEEKKITQAVSLKSPHLFEGKTMSISLPKSFDSSKLLFLDLQKNCMLVLFKDKQKLLTGKIFPLQLLIVPHPNF